MSEHQHGGQRRIDRVLAPEFLSDLAQVDDATLLARREDAAQEEADLSYVRRMLQGRLDLLRSEQHRRLRGGSVGADDDVAHSDEDLVALLSQVLAPHEEPAGQGVGRGGAPVGVGAPRAGEHRRAAEAAVADVRVSDLAHLDDGQLAAAIARLDDLETQLSATRARAQHATDTLNREITRRVEAGRMPADAGSPLG